MKIELILALALTTCLWGEPLSLRKRPYDGVVHGQGSAMMIQLQEMARIFEWKVLHVNDAYLVETPPETPASAGQVFVFGQPVAAEESDSGIFVNVKEFAQAAGLSYEWNGGMSRFEVDRVVRTAKGPPTSLGAVGGSDLVPIRDSETGLYGYKSGKVWVIEPKFAHATEFAYGYAYAVLPSIFRVKHEKVVTGYRTTTEVKTDPYGITTGFGDTKFEELGYTQKKTVEKRGKYGVISTTGEWVCPPKFERGVPAPPRLYDGEVMFVADHKGKSYLFTPNGTPVRPWDPQKDVPENRNLRRIK